jgi:hypothetical protein
VIVRSIVTVSFAPRPWFAVIATGLKAIHPLQRLLHFVRREAEEFGSGFCIQLLREESL